LKYFILERSSFKKYFEFGISTGILLVTPTPSSLRGKQKHSNINSYIFDYDHKSVPRNSTILVMSLFQISTRRQVADNAFENN